MGLESFNKIIGVAVLSSRWIFRQPLWMFQSAIVIAGLFIMLTAWGGIEAIKNLALAFTIVGFWNDGLNIIAQTFGWSKIEKSYEMFIASSISIPEYYLGLTLGSLIFAIIDLIPSIIILYWLKLLSILPYLMILGIVALLIGSFLGLTIVLRIKNPTNISAVTNPISALTTILPPIYYPSILLPKPIAYTLVVVPTASLMEIARNLLGIKTLLTLTQGVIVLTVWIIVVVILLIKVIKWGLE